MNKQVRRASPNWQHIMATFSCESDKESFPLIADKLRLERKSTFISTMVDFYSMVESYSGTTFKAGDTVDIADHSVHVWKVQPVNPERYATTKYPNLQYRVYVGSATKLPPDSISIKKINSDIGIFVLVEPLEVTFEMDEDTYICWNEDFKLYGCGSSREEALRELESFFGDIYDSYRNTPESELTEDAKQLLKKFNEKILTEL